jgi:hypothetical protein
MGSVLPRGIRGDSAAQRFERLEARGILPRGWIDGLVLSNDGTDATNDIGISAGACRSTSNIGPDGIRTTLAKYQADLEIPVTIIKQLDVAWAPENYDPENGIGGGGRSGLRSSSSISDTTWHVFAIGGLDCPTDILAHDGVDPSAVLPNGYTAWRALGSILRASAALVLFTQSGDFFRLKAPPLDVDSTSITTSASTQTLTVPTGLSVRALCSMFTAHAAAAHVYIKHPDDTDSAPSTTAAPLVTGGTNTSDSATGQFVVETNASRQITVRSTASSTTVRIATAGWWHPRGKDA